MKDGLCPQFWVMKFEKTKTSFKKAGFRSYSENIENFPKFQKFYGHFDVDRRIMTIFLKKLFLRVVVPVKIS